MKNLSKEEMKGVIGGLVAPPSCSGSCDYQWTDSKGGSHTTSGSCLLSGGDTTGGGHCYCSNGEGSCS